MKTILIPVIDKIAQSPDDEIVCGNSDYYIEFAFDSEWDGYDVKTARFVYSGKKTDVVFEGNTVQVPVMANTTKVFVGVFSGDLRTSTPAAIVCRPSILCKGGMPHDPTPDVYAQIMEMLNGWNGGGQSTKAETVTLSAGSWSADETTGAIQYKVKFEGVTADSTVICSPVPNLDMENEVANCMVRCIEQGDGYLVFESLNGTAPTIDIDMNILVVSV